MRILFHMSPDVDHLEATFPFARALASRGHEVVYTAALDLQAAIEARGMRCAPIHRDIFPRGAFAERERLHSGERHQAWLDAGNRVADEYFRGRIEAFVRELDPDIIIADVIAFSPIQFVAHRLGLPCLQLSISLPQRIDNLPPLTTALRPDASPLQLEGARWQESCLRRATPMIISAGVDRYAARFGYSTEDVSFATVFYPALTMFPELIACASALDFPHARDRLPSFGALPVDLDRAEEVPAVLAAFVRDARPLIYASLGRRVARFPHVKRFFAAVIGALRARPDWKAVIDPGDLDDPMFASLPANVLPLRAAPQLWLLRRAAVFATQAGIADVREAIALRVPMIAVPQQNDQHGNAARVSHHGAGIHLPVFVINEAAVMAAVETLQLAANRYPERLRELDEACREEEAENRGVAMIERLAAGRPAGPKPIPSRLPESVVRVGWLFFDPATALGERLAPGIVLDRPDDAEALGVGSGGFTICPSLGDALARADGRMLARVEVMGEAVCDGPFVVGRKLRCRWIFDAAHELFEFAEWCALAALEPELATSPERVAMFTDLLQEHRLLRLSGAAPDRLDRVSRTALSRAAKLWHHGYGTAALAIAPAPHRAAQTSRLEAIISLARADVAEAAGTPEGAGRYESQYVAIAKRVDDELERQIVGATIAAGLDSGGEFVGS
jgi:zeaxanthin glucosyltransferase